MKKVTIKDLAKLANVSPTTISLVLNDKPSRISLEKKKEIKDLALKFNYVPNLNAKGLVTNKTNIIGLIIPDIENPFFASLAKAIETKLNENNYSLILINTNDLYENDIKSIRLLNGRGVDGFLIVVSNESFLKKDEMINELNNLSKPYVLIDRGFSDLDNNEVSFDDEYGGFIATNYLLEQDHKKVGFIAAPKSSFSGSKRTKGYKAALTKHGLNVDENLITYGDYKFNSGYLNALKLLDQNVDAIFAANDVMAYGAIKAINEKGLKLKTNVSLIGYDDLMFSDMNLVSLTTIKQDQEVLGEEAVRILFKSIINNDYKEKVILKPNLTIRDTVKEKVK